MRDHPGRVAQAFRVGPPPEEGEDAAAAPASLLQDKELDDLLARNEQLSEVNAALNAQHALLGKSLHERIAAEVDSNMRVLRKRASPSLLCVSLATRFSYASPGLKPATVVRLAVQMPSRSCVALSGTGVVVVDHLHSNDWAAQSLVWVSQPAFVVPLFKAQKEPSSSTELPHALPYQLS